MKTLDLKQGEAAWHAHRANSRNASDAAAMLGCSPYMTRTQLLHAMHTGIRPEPTPDQQRRFDKGHEIEAAKRAVAEAIIGEDLYPVVGSAEVDGIELSASFDGLTMLEDTNWECKSLNADLRAALPYTGDPAHNQASQLPKAYRVQLEQQCAVSGCNRVLFTASDGQDDDRHCWYYPDPALRAEIIAGWKQLAADSAAYVPPAASAVEKIVAETVESLPAPVVQVSGQLTLQDNFKVFEDRLRHFLEHRLIREPKTDQDFVDLDAQIKAMKQAREALGAAEAQMLAQVEPVDRAKKTKDMLDKLLQQNLSMAERLLKDEKERRRGEIVAAGVAALKAHIDGLNQRLGKPYMPVIPADFGGCVKGLKSLSSMEDKVSGELARAKIAANDIADRIQINLNWLREHAKDHTALFPDTSTIVLKAHDDLVALAQNRINEHKAAEAKRLEAERERIRKEEQAKADEKAAVQNRMRMSEISGIQQQVMIATLGRAGVRKGGTIECIRDTLAETEAWTIEESNFGPLTFVAQEAKDKALTEIRTLLADAEASAASAKALTEAGVATREPAEPRRQDDWAALAQSPAPAPISSPAPLWNGPRNPDGSCAPVRANLTAAAPNVVPMQRPSAAPAAPPTMTLGQINDRLGRGKWSEADLTALGFPPAATRQNTKLYHDADFGRMVDSIVAHLRTVQAIQAQQVA
jgi:predicted phage-related endonuclease